MVELVVMIVIIGHADAGGGEEVGESR